MLMIDVGGKKRKKRVENFHVFFGLLSSDLYLNDNNTLTLLFFYSILF